MIDKAKYLFVTIADVDPEYEKDYFKWMTEEHMPDLIKVPGVIRGMRYISHQGSSPKHMAIYELESPYPPQSEAWDRTKYTEKSKYIKGHVQRKATNVFELVDIIES